MLTTAVRQRRQTAVRSTPKTRKQRLQHRNRIPILPIRILLWKNHDTGIVLRIRSAQGVESGLRGNTGRLKEGFRGRSCLPFLSVRRYGFAASTFSVRKSERGANFPRRILAPAQLGAEQFLCFPKFLCSAGKGVTGADVSPTAQGDDPLGNPRFAGA